MGPLLFDVVARFKESEMSNDRKLLAVLIDADNIPARYADDILREVTKYGEPALRRVYGDWSSAALGNWKKIIYAYRAELLFVFKA